MPVRWPRVTPAALTPSAAARAVSTLAATVAATLAVTSLTVAGPAAAAAAAAAAARSSLAATAPVPSRANVGAPHSPELLRQLAAPRAATGTITPGLRHAELAGAPPLTAPLRTAPALTTPAVATPAAPGPSPLAGAVQGVDVASFQHPNGAAINWADVAAAGVGFAAVKVTEGDYYVNPYAVSDLTQARAAGLTVAAYAFAIPNGNGSSASPATQADDLVTALGADAASMPLMLDVEYDPYTSTDHTNQCYGLSTTAMVTWISEFTAEIRAKTGQQPLIYTPPAWWKACTGSAAAFGQDPLWVPDYTSAAAPALPGGWARWSFWQYTSSGTVSGIPTTGSTDLDQLNPGVVTLLDPGTQQATAGTAISPVQLTPVTPTSGGSGPAPTLTYSAAGLPPGLVLNSATGQVTGTPATIGTYAVTITAQASPDVSGTVSFSWDVHGTIVVSPIPPQTTVAGSAVLLRAAATDATSGQTLSFSASGLPPGVSISTSGVMTGWPTPGTFHVTVTATDGLQATGSASFTWTVRGAADTGPAGRVRLDLGGKCLNDVGNSSARGTRVSVSTCNSSAAQHWTVVADGTLRIHGQCLATVRSGISNGTQVGLQPCTDGAAQRWTVQAGGELVNGKSGTCLGGPGRTNGPYPFIWQCTGQPIQRWIRPAGPVALEIPGTCLDDAEDSSAAGTRAELWSCDGHPAQNWTVEPDGTLRILGRCLQTVGSATASGTGVDIEPCTGTGTQVWHLNASGAGVRVKNAAAGLCLADPGDASASGTALEVLPCVSGDPGLVWGAR
jgi:GH25 family lysozyme M1 (1,4-beta-N-acetylmuramidase)